MRADHPNLRLQAQTPRERTLPPWMGVSTDYREEGPHATAADPSPSLQHDIQTLLPVSRGEEQQKGRFAGNIPLFRVRPLLRRKDGVNRRVSTPLQVTEIALEATP